MKERIPALIKGLLILWGSTITTVLAAQQQPINDECVSAVHIQSAVDYCSDKGQFRNAGATESPEIPVECFPSSITDVWFTFFAATPAVVIQVNGADGGQNGTLEQPSLALLEGSCTGGFNEIACGSDAVNNQNVELVVDDLIIGQLYYLRVDARNGSIGTFQLCIKSFVPTNEPSGDCPTATILCDKSPFVIEELIGDGDIRDEADNSCLDIDPRTGLDDGNSENSSVWLTWTCDTAGTLEFTLTPTSENLTEDLDFALYELPNGIGDCTNKRPLRCMASGENVGEPFADWARCTGPTGLREGETDITEERGCAAGDNNFLAPIEMDSGATYVLVVNNFSQSGRGFEVEWGGTGTFLGPEANFEVDAVQAFECDKTIIFTNLSDSPTDPIDQFTWNFGAGGTPVTISGPGPHNVVYESFGEKRAALTVETSRGCRITKIVDLYVEPCCADTSTLEVDALVQDLLCPGINSGEIEAMGIRGAPIYQYSLNGDPFQPSAVYPLLGPGLYQLVIQDEKGCRDSIDVEVMDAEGFTIDVPDTLVTELGKPVRIIATPNPPNIQSVDWTLPETLTFDIDSLSPMALAPGSTVYTVTATSPEGCVAADDVLILVEITRPVYIPNVFTPNSDGINDWFYASAGPAAQQILEFRVFNRWGAVVYEGLNVPYGDEQSGWDGMFKGELVEPGVFAYQMKIQFIDGYVGDYSGSVTVIR